MSTRERVEQAEAFILLAKHYAKVKKQGDSSFVKNIRLEAMMPYVRGEKTVFFRASTYKEILEAVKFAELFDLKPVILGGGEAWKCAESLAKKEIPVIVTEVFTIPRSRFERFDAFYTNASRLEDAGVLFCIATRRRAVRTAAPYPSRVRRRTWSVGRGWPPVNHHRRGQNLGCRQRNRIPRARQDRRYYHHDGQSDAGGHTYCRELSRGSTRRAHEPARRKLRAFLWRGRSQSWNRRPNLEDLLRCGFHCA